MTASSGSSIGACRPERPGGSRTRACAVNETERELVKRRSPKLPLRPVSRKSTVAAERRTGAPFTATMFAPRPGWKPRIRTFGLEPLYEPIRYCHKVCRLSASASDRASSDGWRVGRRATGRRPDLFGRLLAERVEAADGA